MTGISRAQGWQNGQ